MADPYIDPNETQIYGPYAREQLEKVCLGRVKELDGAVKFAIVAQERADSDMKAVLDRQPKPAAAEDTAEALDEARDLLVRFGSYLSSLKGYPVNPKVFFFNENPSAVARKRLVKLTAAVGHIVNEIPKQDAIKDPTWLKEFKSAHKKLEAIKSATQDAKLEKADLGPEVGSQREKWLATYSANKLLLRGVLAHAGKPELLPLIFDDLAEAHRTAGVSDQMPAPPAPAEPAPAEPL